MKYKAKIGVPKQNMGVKNIAKIVYKSFIPIGVLLENGNKALHSFWFLFPNHFCYSLHQIVYTNFCFIYTRWIFYNIFYNKFWYFEKIIGVKNRWFKKTLTNTVQSWGKMDFAVKNVLVAIVSFAWLHEKGESWLHVWFFVAF